MNVFKAPNAAKLKLRNYKKFEGILEFLVRGRKDHPTIVVHVVHHH